MKRVTLRVPEEQLDKIETLVENGEYPSKSEVLRSGLRNELAHYDFNEPFQRQEKED